MTKRMREIQAEIVAKTAEAQGYSEKKEYEKAETVLNEIDELQKAFEVEERLEKAEKKGVPIEEPKKKEEKVDSFKVMAKALSGAKLTEEEKALVTGTNATSGENYLIPEDVRFEINELRKSYVSARDIVNVETTNALTGSVLYEAGTPAGLTNFTDGGEDGLAEDTHPAFTRKNFAIAFMGKLIPISRILLGSEKAALMAYLNRWFVKNAIISENASIFAKLKAGYNSGTPKAVGGWKALKKSINADLDPSCKLAGMLVTNQSGFAALDEEEDANGRPILQENPANPTQKLFQGLPIKVYPDAQLPNIDTTHFPVFYGDTKAGCSFVEKDSLEFAISEHYGFDKNQNFMRVIEGYDVMSTDTSAYIYGSFTATAK